MNSEPSQEMRPLGSTYTTRYSHCAMFDSPFWGEPAGDTAGGRTPGCGLDAQFNYTPPDWGSRDRASAPSAGWLVAPPTRKVSCHSERSEEAIRPDSSSP